MPGPPWLSTLPKAARAFYPIALKGVSEGLSANRILKAYSLAKPGIKRSIGLDVIRAIKGVEKKASAFSSLKKLARPDPAKIPTAITKLLNKYSYKVGYEGITDQGKPFAGWVTVSTPDLITRQEAEETASEWLETLPQKYGIESIEKVQLSDIRQSSFWD